MNTHADYNPQPKKAVILSKYELRKLKDEVYARDNWTCQICDKQMVCLQPHHIIPTGRIRLDVKENILTTCVVCHRLVHDTPGMVDELIEKYSYRLPKWSKSDANNFS